MTGDETEVSKGSSKIVLTDRKKRSIFIFLLLGILGAWLNAQGGWVKDFSYNRIVVLPFFFQNYTTTGFQWYLVGIFDDLLGFASNLVGIYGFKRLVNIAPLNTYRRRYFIIPVIVYLVVDLFSFLNFNNYYNGITDIALYGEYWNLMQYFGLVPAFVLADCLLILYNIEK